MIGRMKKKLLTILVSIIGIMVIGAAVFKVRYDTMVRRISDEIVYDVNLHEIDDGVYSGCFGDFLVSVSLDVTVSDNRIATVEITAQHCGPGYESLETVDRILEAQSPCVDAVSGATNSSRCIMIAVYKALTDKDI